MLDHDLADDLTQDVFAKVFKSLTTFRGESAFDTWIHRIAVNVTYGHLRQSRLRKTSAVLVDVVDTDAVPSSRVLESEQRDRLADALASLKPALRTAIVLTVLQGMTAIEAAEIEKCSVGTMYWRIHQARQALKAALKDWLP